MDLLLINLICITFLFLASVQDIIKKSVSDVIHYLSLIFSFSFIITSIIYDFLPMNIFFGYLLLLMFVILYIFRLLAIGDLYMMFFLFYFLSYQSLNSIIKFLIGLSFFGSLMQAIEAIKIYYRKRDYKKMNIFVLSSFLILISLTLFLYSLNDIINRFNLFLISILLLMFPLIVFKIYEKEIRESLTFKRKVDELVEGDWIEGEIEIKDLNLLDELKKNFLVIEKDGKYFIKFDKYDIKKKLYILLISIFPMVFLNNQVLFIISILISILILTIKHDYFFEGELGLSKKQIEVLKKALKDEEFIVKEGAPFIPAIFLSYIISIL